MTSMPAELIISDATMSETPPLFVAGPKIEFRLNENSDEFVDIDVNDDDTDVECDDEVGDTLLNDGSAIWGRRPSASTVSAAASNSINGIVLRPSGFLAPPGGGLSNDNLAADAINGNDARLWASSTAGAAAGTMGTLGAMRFHRLTRHRHYKKDSRFIRDLYVVCYDENESPESMGLEQQSPWLTSPISNATLADQPPASLPPMAAYDRRLGSPVMPRKPKRALQRATAANNSNLQICFMPEAALDSDEDQDMASENGETAGMDRRLPSPMQFKSLPASRRYSSTKSAGPVVESTSSTGNSRKASVDDSTQEDFWRKQARLQAEARIALAQATHMAKMQMEVERQRKKNSPISDMILLPQSCAGHRRLSRTLLSRISNTELNSIHTSLIMEVKKLNEELMTNLLLRDELHMEQDSMLVDLEDLTRYLSAKEDILRVRGPQYQVPLNNNNNNNNNPSTKQTGVTASLRNSRFSSLKSLVKF